MGKLFDGNKDLVLVLGTIMILLILFSPIPPAMLDLAIIINFGFGLTIMLLTFYVTKPVEFSTFPSLLLVATLYRLSLNVAATRLILTDADAGHVIEAIGNYAVQGNFVIGLVVFTILVVVQYVVVTSGAQRVSEVAARFTLDSMPGQQMSIDADLNLGLITQQEAIDRRAELEKEASFYGAMDGASKFVKGDAIAGIIILLINIIAGLIVGVVQMGMTWGDALHRFTLLTIGDGIATQLPALIISIATGIIVTRSSADKQLSAEIFRQLASEPRIPLIVMAVMVALMLLPGMPKWPIAVIAGIALIAWLRIRRLRRAAAEGAVPEDDAPDTPLPGKLAPALEVAFGSQLAEAWGAKKALLLDRIASSRVAHERMFGIAFPTVRFIDANDIGTLDYRIAIHGVTYGNGQLYPHRMLAIAQRDDAPRMAGIEGRDPAFGIPGLWIEPDLARDATEAGYSVIDPETVLITHFGQIMKMEVATLLTRAVTGDLLDQLRTRQPGLVEELVPNVMTISDVQRILQNLLQERVSIANLDLIVETLVDVGRTERDPLALTEQVRQALSTAICNGLRGHNAQLSVLSLDPRLENQIIAGLNTREASALGIEPRLAEQLLRKLAPLAEAMLRQGKAPVLLCAGPIRRILLKLTQRSIPQLAILSVDEIPLRLALQSFDMVKLEA
ncbi:flagellar biosynthesis protein FlhA [Caenibius tardaugens NBRC 16725]|uniref:Flagellar biosynthesis protein FlhA n=1 Tax=Caenibius tardaugens NBRC 16725 TaxID=1219035 RepID=U2YBE0_9SPHN|nr:flagellar biosynthesis protein FlhA [Caenibius tardaugens]AZI36403.1 flagellar type III secretion system protein FlhA [Caenibius tardaugens NBRC 16725]GAD50786.1 flagellar biosynthesis protein FlhA [Caenibius tardaugens NBRC 16725]